MIGVSQYRKLMKEYSQSGKISSSACKAGVDRGTAAKYVKGSPGPEEPRERRHWRTHADAFAQVWPAIESRLELEPRLQAKSLWEALLEEHPGEFDAGQRRTFERRVAEWKQRHGEEPELFFAQEHRQGERLQIDWVDARELGITVEGQPFAHKLVHVVLPYSNWQWARACLSESYLSLKVGLQSALFELGGCPRICQSDQSSTATHQLRRGSRKRDYNARYLSLLAHYRMQPALISVGEPHENGDVEVAHGHLLRALEQALMLRGNRDFPSVQAYESLLEEVLRKRNANRQKRLEQELAVLGALPSIRLPEYEEEEVQVSRESVVRVGKQGYSLPSRWAGQRLRARISETRIAFYQAEMLVTEVERCRGSSGVYINWRHVIGQLARKPGAWVRWRHREAMFPNMKWRKFYDHLCKRYSSGRAEREYLGVLLLALEEGLERIEGVLDALGQESGLDSVRSELKACRKIVVVDFVANLSEYDAILQDGDAPETKEAEHG